MFKNYLKIFLKVSRQNKLFTFLGLFGISLTIMFVLIVMMTLDSVVNGSGPEKNSKDIMYAWRMIVRTTMEGESGINPVSLTIEDNGSGISEEVKEKLFTPFFTTKPDGQGIGLTFIAEILENHSYSYGLKTIGKTTRFRIVFT